MAFGKSIRIYLKDGSVTGIKFGEVVNQTIQAIASPRSRVSELASNAECKRPGVYFLFGQDEETGEQKAPALLSLVLTRYPYVSDYGCK